MATVSDTSLDTGILDDRLIHQISFMTSEVGVLNDASDGFGRAFTSLDTAVLNDTLLVAQTGLTNVTRETAVGNDALRTAIATPTAEAAVLNDAILPSVVATQTLESAVLDDAALVPVTLANVSTDAGVLNDAILLRVVVDVAAETAVLDDAITPSRIVTLTLEAAVLDDSGLPAWIPINTIAESAVLNDALSSEFTAVDLIAESGILDDRLLGAVLLAAAWVAGTDMFNVSRYTNWPFNSLAVVDGQLVALGEDGAYLVGGTTDAGESIAASTRGDITDAIDGRQGPQPDSRARRPAYLYLSYASNGTVKFIVGETGDGIEQEHEFDLPARAAIDVIGGRAELDKGIESRFFRFGFANVDGSQFAIDDGRVLYNMLQRRA